MNQDQLIALLAQSPGYVSGQEMSQTLGVTRGAIWKELSQLREQGRPAPSALRPLSGGAAVRHHLLGPHSRL